VEVQSISPRCFTIEIWSFDSNIKKNSPFVFTKQTDPFQNKQKNEMALKCKDITLFTLNKVLGEDGP